MKLIPFQWYDPDAVTTKDGVLELRFDAFQNHGLNYRSGMLQSWNKMCFTGGLLEASISLPGRGDTVGFWPGFWSMGNLGRPGYAATTEGMWPYSYDNVCDPGITANQSSSDGISYLPGMKMPACTCDDQDHPNPGKSRSAPEIDVLEASVAAIDKKNMVGQVSQSCQIAPFDIWYYPDYGKSDKATWLGSTLTLVTSDYFELYDPSVTTINSYTGGPYQQAISGLSFLNNDWYDGKVYQTYSFDYSPGKEGEITWYIGPDKTYKLDARALRPNGNVGQRTIPAEPMSMILNFGMSSGFSSLNFTGLGATLPATMRIDYVRIYQDPNSENLGCDPEDYPTTEYIRNHPDVYTNTNLTSWYELFSHSKSTIHANFDTAGPRQTTSGRRTPWCTAVPLRIAPCPYAVHNFLITPTSFFGPFMALCMLYTLLAQTKARNHPFLHSAPALVVPTPPSGLRAPLSIGLSLT